MHYFDMNLKRCIQCNKPNRSSYRRCKTCRKLCKLHGEYHDDNAVHTRPPPQPRVVPPQPRVVPPQPRVVPPRQRVVPLAEYEIESDPIPQMYLNIQTHSSRKRFSTIPRHLHEGYMNVVLEPRRRVDQSMLDMIIVMPSNAMTKIMSISLLHRFVSHLPSAD
jgi:hypothetical protein